MTSILVNSFDGSDIVIKRVSLGLVMKNITLTNTMRIFS